MSEEQKVKISVTCKSKGIKPPKIFGRIPWNKGLRQEKYRDKHGGVEYTKWRKAIYERDEYTCQNCKKVGGKLQAHHIKSWKQYPELRLEINNGITLCEECHKLTDNYGGKARIKQNADNNTETV